MKYLLGTMIAAFVLTIGGVSAFAQDERTKAEVFLGYSHERLDTGLEDEDGFDGIDDTVGAHGFEGAVTGNVHKYVGLKFDFSHHRKSERFTDGSDSANLKFTLNQFLGGLQFKNNKKEGSRVRPFAHVLAGLSRHTFSGDGTFVEPDGKGGGTPTSFDFSESTNSFGMAVGGGVDVHLGRRVDLRLFQVDYNPIWLRDRTFSGVGFGEGSASDLVIEGRRLDNFRFSFGIVIH